MGLARKLSKRIGARVTDKFLAVRNDETVGNIKNILINRSKAFETIDYIYVVDASNVLQGVVSLKELLQTSNETVVESIMKTNVISIDPHAHQERIIYLVLEDGFKAIPVVDGHKHLLGVVPYHAILDIFHHEFREDILKSAGIHHEIKEIEKLSTPTLKLVKVRLPALIIGLVGCLIAAYIVSGYEEILSSYLVLAAFIPLVIYLSDAVGTQSQTLIVRMIATDPKFSTRRYLTREIKIGAILGTIFAVLLFAAAMLGWGIMYFAAVIGTSMFIGMLFQAFIATYLSIVLTKFHVDPAVTSGPITTIISDITTLVVYFSIASVLLRFV